MSRILDPQTGEIDWLEFRERVAQAFESSLDASQPSKEQAQEILEERARRLAFVPAETDRQLESIEVLPFRLGREQYGMETRFAREVARLSDFTMIPGTPDFVIGVANLRGEIVPVFDLMLFFGFASQGLMDRSRMIVVGMSRPDFGIIADTVQEVSTLSLEEFVPNPSFEGARGRECIRGITRDAMIVLDGAALSSDRNLFIGSPDNAAF
jgi:purine-binding chemotaxis protein CheW